VEVLQTLEIEHWQPAIEPGLSERLALSLEQGKVLYLPRLHFALLHDEQAFFSPQWLSGKRKNISLEGSEVRGATGSAQLLGQLGAMIGRYCEHSSTLINGLFPGYTAQVRRARTSFRPSPVEGPAPSWKKDDSRLHVDAFPSRPNYGERILRVFTNVNPAGMPRIWRVGESFEVAAQRFLPKIARPLPGSAQLLHMLGITKSRRSEYDHIMLQLHDRMKADLDFQANSPQQEVHFSFGSTWVCFSDQVLHAAMSGQFMFEQTFHLPVAGQYYPQTSPLRVLERLRGRALVS
jgi:3-deoxy-D-manno-oct-2-ulosonic acid (Kdo) hydroxylase